MNTYFDTDYASICYDANNHLLISACKIPPLSQEFRVYMEALLIAVEHFKTGKVIADIVKIGTLHPDDQEWASTDWNSRAVKVGYSHAAILLPKDVYSQMAIEDTMNGVTGSVAFSYFDNMESALAWINVQ